MSSQARIDRRRERRLARREAFEKECRDQGLIYATTIDIVPTDEASERGADRHLFTVRSKEPLAEAQIRDVIKQRGGDPALCKVATPILLR